MASLALVPILLAIPFFIFILIFSLSLFWNPHGLPWNWPILGTIPTVIRHIHRIHDRITEILIQTSSSTFSFKGIWFTNTDFIMTVHPPNIHHIMTLHFHNYPKGPDFRHIFDILGDGIFNSDHDSWRAQRRTAQALIGDRRFLDFMARAATEKVAKGLVGVLDFASQKGSVVDLQDLFLRLAFDSTCMMVTGFDLNSLCVEFPEIGFSKAMDEAQEVIFVRHLMPRFLWELQKKLHIGEAKRMNKATEVIDHTIAKLLAIKRDRIKAAASHQFNHEFDHQQDDAADLITWYMDKFLRDTILNFMIAGRDALSICLSWFFFSLSQNPKVVTKIREELKAIIPQHSQSPNQPTIFAIEELDNLVYLHAALCETLRLYPPIAFQHKSPAEADMLPSGHRVKPHTVILISMYALGRIRSVWGEDCEEFKPERWISERGTVKREASYKFFSFNAGPRTCLGKGVAFSQLKIVSAAIIHNYNIEAVKENNVVTPSASVMLHMKNGFKVRVSKRWSHE